MVKNCFTNPKYKKIMFPRSTFTKRDFQVGWSMFPTYEMSLGQGRLDNNEA